VLRAGDERVVGVELEVDGFSLRTRDGIAVGSANLDFSLDSGFDAQAKGGDVVYDTRRSDRAWPWNG